MSDNSDHRQLAVTIVRDLPSQDLVVVQNWAEGLIAIRESSQGRMSKARSAIRVTLASKVIWTAAKLVAARTKKIGWDDRSNTARLGLLGAGLGVALFGGQSAGIAALGTAVGLPLWIVLGAGSSFAGVFIDEIKVARSKAAQPVDPPL